MHGKHSILCVNELRRKVVNENDKKAVVFYAGLYN